jgi:hypothetical protein
MRKMTINCYLAGEAGLAAPLNDSVSLRMRKMNYFRESAVTWLVRLGWRPRGRAGVPRLLGEEMQGPDKYAFLSHFRSRGKV